MLSHIVLHDDEPTRDARRTRLRAALAAALFVGCAGVPAPREPYTDAARAIRAHDERRASLHAIRAEARVDQRGRSGRVKGTVFMLVDRSSRLRFDAMTLFGPVAILTADAERFAYTDLREQRFVTGATCPENIARLVGIPMTVEQATLTLLGGTFVVAHDEEELLWNDDGFYRVSLRSRSGARQEIDFSLPDADLARPPADQRLRLRRSELYGATGESLWRVTYDDYRELGGGPVLPFEVRIEQARSATDTLVRFKRIDVDPELPDTAFVQEARPGLRREELECD
jgi:hypothetical protein